MTRPITIAAAAALLCACAAESEIAPRTPVNAQLVPHETMRNPDIRDGLPQLASPYADPTRGSAPPPAPPRRSISLGFIGDEPVGLSEPPGEPSWARPFPCHWTRTCWIPPEAAVIHRQRWGGRAP